MTEFVVGTSGYAYKEWKGRFYPEKMKPTEMLGFYAQRFGTVEINNTFYRMPSRDVLVHWAEQVPDSFVFVLKAPRKVTHVKRLGDVGGEVSHLLETASALGARLGPLLFQLPPYMKKDTDRLAAFLEQIPEGTRVALEFRHASWDDAEVHGILTARGAALCLADMDDDPQPRAIVPTTGWGYLRLRRKEYTDAELAGWIERIRAQPWAHAYVFFKHEDEARGPAFAERFLALCSG
jgi:uncharacterized protein YecE (DUF72 family)